MNHLHIYCHSFQTLHCYEHFNVSRYCIILQGIIYEPPSHLLSHLASTTILYFLLVFMYGPALPEHQMSCLLTTSRTAHEGYAWSTSKITHKKRTLAADRVVH